LNLVPINISDAKEFVARVHRTHRAPVSGLFAIAVGEGDKVLAVAIIGRPVARALDDGWTAEVTRVASDGAKNACSMLYGAAWRAARAMGYRRLVTYTLASENGASLRASGYTNIAETAGGSWNTPSRPRVDRHPTQAKFRWERSA
jgi:hypothetical protein